MPPELIHALGLVKWACAKANAELGLLQSGRSPLTEEQIDALLTACLEVAEGKFDDQFPVDVYQTGSGTSTNMNANEVIANRANEIIANDEVGNRPMLKLAINLLGIYSRRPENTRLLGFREVRCDNKILYFSLIASSAQSE